jgi:hypothetical protein
LRVDRAGGPDACWLWDGHRRRDGYGHIIAGSPRTGRREVLAHRQAFEYTSGPIPLGAFVCHRCDNPCCCNPAHLFVGTHADNMADMARKGRRRGIASVRGEAHGNAIFTEADIRAIRRECEAGALQREVGARFGVDQAVISNIVRRKRWAHVD